MDDSSQGLPYPLPPPYTGYAAFMFAHTSPAALCATLRSLGAHLKPGPRNSWCYPEGDPPLLECHVIDDVRDYAIDLIWEVWKWYVPLLKILEVEELNALILSVSIRDQPSAIGALHTFAVKLLEKHRGAVKESRTNRVWMRDDIANQVIRDGRRFFERLE